LTTLDFVG